LNGKKQHYPPPHTHTHTYNVLFIIMKTETLFIYFKTSCCSHPVKLTQVQNGAKTPRTVTCNDKSIKPKNYVKNPFATTNIVLKKVSGK